MTYEDLLGEPGQYTFLDSCGYWQIASIGEGRLTLCDARSVVSIAETDAIVEDLLSGKIRRIETRTNAPAPAPVPVVWTFNSYQREASRTLPPNTEPSKTLNLGALGLGGESGEVIDLLKKHLFHDQPLDRDKLRKELGDVLWYLSAITTGAGLTLQEVADANVEKLRKRYPDGFSPAASVAKADEK